MSQSDIIPDEPERWLAVPGWEELYEVSSLGRVRSLPRRTVCGVRGGQVLKTRLRGEYWGISLYRRGGRIGKQYTVHKLVAMAFLGPIPDGMNVLHGPAGALDNRVGNLRIGTQRENIHDKFRDGTMPLGERHHEAKLTDAAVAEMRARYAHGEAIRALAASYGIAFGVARKALNGEAWGHIAAEPVALRPSRGEVLPQAKLTAADIPVIRARCAAGEPQKDLAAEYGVCKQSISNIVRGLVWKHVA